MPPRTCQTSALSRFLQYAYFLRFPIIGWLSLPLLCLLDSTGASSFTRGIMTMSRGWQLFHTTFFSVALLMAVLICTRNIVINGSQRFNVDPPDWLHRLLIDDAPSTMWSVLLFAQLPALLTLVYVGVRTVAEQTGWARGQAEEAQLLATVWPYGGMHWQLYMSYALGFFAAFAFWYLVSVFYYWTYPAPTPEQAGNTDTQMPVVPTRTAMPLIFPIRKQWSQLIDLAKHAEKPLFAEWLEWLVQRVLRLQHIGYADGREKPLYELHFLSIVSLCAIVLLYLFLNPLVSPVIVATGFSTAAILTLLVFLAFAIGALSWKHRRMQAIGLLFTLLLLGFLLIFYGFFIADARSHATHMETSFPTMGAILVILIFFQWLFCGATFFLDRFRLPVLSVVAAFIFLPKFLPINQEHYFAAISAGMLSPSDVDSPAAAIQHRLGTSKEGEPLIIVTAMGGGIQAAEWTAQIMAAFEARVRDDSELQARHYTFHDHLLLASGVSGGSVGLMPYMLEYTAPPGRQFQTASGEGGRDLLTTRLTAGPGCSGLEAVAWGLEYYDLQRFLFTIEIPWLQRTNTGVSPDRTWALTEAFNRNLHDKDCGTKGLPQLPKLYDGKQMTLIQAAHALKSSTMPAFAFNTTVAETGDRFLLSNYAVPRNASSVFIRDSSLRRGSGFVPAESFLQAYTMLGCCGPESGGKGLYADLSLATAARLSATFPIVSSGTRIPLKFAPVASHFLDGGYYDNDGTATAIEFLASAMTVRGDSTKQLSILLVEIRDSGDLDPGLNEDDLAHQTGAIRGAYGAAPPSPWSTFGQIMAPLSGMWNAGHKSTTRRNRRELCLLEHAYNGHGLQIHHVIFGIPSEVDQRAKRATKNQVTYKPSPLSWKLTESQKQYIVHWASAEQATRDSFIDALGWLRDPHRTFESCSVEDQPQE